jgi:hypothetical protein
MPGYSISAARNVIGHPVRRIAGHEPVRADPVPVSLETRPVGDLEGAGVLAAQSRQRGRG